MMKRLKASEKKWDKEEEIKNGKGGTPHVCQVRVWVLLGAGEK